MFTVSSESRVNETKRHNTTLRLQQGRRQGMEMKGGFTLSFCSGELAHSQGFLRGGLNAG